ncbi:MAG: hypothetical protein GWO24_13350, partial [Akkermansiaceae bacterium]|nr:hypothetical protein [Akkermansiaceae bacterium]
MTSTTPGEFVVYSNFGASPVEVSPAAPVDNEFLYDESNDTDLPAPTTDLLLSEGKYLVLY